MKFLKILVGLAFLVAASLACNFGARRASPTATPIAIMPPTEVAAASQTPLSTENPVQPPTPPSGNSSVTVVPTIPAGVSQPGEIRQWAASATASSQYGNPEWAAAEATGAPNVTACGDDSSAWASSAESTVEWLELTYSTPVKPFQINIYQTFNPGQIVKVELFSPDGQTVYHVYTATPAKVETCPQVLTLSLDGATLTQVNRIRITVDQSVLGVGWAEIDAVELVGVK